MISKADRFHDYKGRLNAYAYACGYVTKCEGFTLGMDHTVFFVRGFDRDGIHIARYFRSLNLARKFLTSLTSQKARRLVHKDKEPNETSHYRCEG